MKKKPTHDPDNMLVRAFRFTEDDLELFETARRAQNEDSVSAWVRRTLRAVAKKQTGKS